MKAYFENQTKLLLKVLDTALFHDDYALKGGTAINFFYSDMPRLSVDIDLAYTKITARDEFIEENEMFHQKLSKLLQDKFGLFTQIQRTSEKAAKQITVSSNDSTIKIETNLVFRGTVYPTELRNSCKKIESNYEVLHTVKTLSFEDLYAGKFCAALDRQHPRDLFDVLIFFKNHEFTDKIKVAFLIYLISGNRPISELIEPNRIDQKRAYNNEFQGMVDTQVTYRALEEARENLIETINQSLDEKDRKFLVSFKEGAPNWDHINLSHVARMPAIKWKLYNIQQMAPQKRKQALEKLKKKLGV